LNAKEVAESRCIWCKTDSSHYVTWLWSKLPQ